MSNALKRGTPSSGAVIHPLPQILPDLVQTCHAPENAPPEPQTDDHQKQAERLAVRVRDKNDGGKAREGKTELDQKPDGLCAQITCLPLLAFETGRGDQFTDLAFQSSIAESELQDLILQRFPQMSILKKLTAAALLAGMMVSTQSMAQDAIEKALGETIYVPAYSRIFSYPNRSDLLAATLAVHNVDPETPITLTRIDYHGEDGKKLRSLLEAPVALAPLQSTTVLVPINDTSGGVGSNFLLEWSSQAPALGPITEAIMTSGSGGPGPSFTSRGRVIERRVAE